MNTEILKENQLLTHQKEQLNLSLIQSQKDEKVDKSENKSDFEAKI